MTKRQWWGVALTLLLLFGSFPFISFWPMLPQEVRMVAGLPYELRLPLPFRMSLMTDKVGLTVNDVQLAPGERVLQKGPCTLSSPAALQAKLSLRLFGFLPWGRLRVQVVEPVYVTPGGHSVGVAIRAITMVVGFGPVETAGGIMEPGRNAGLLPGDLLFAANEVRNPSAEQVSEQIEMAGRRGEPLELMVKREGREFMLAVTPALCEESGIWRLGLYLRDEALGVGTLTFVDGVSGVFGALGHTVCDQETGRVLEVQSGKLLRSKVTDIEQGRSGCPGEKRSILVDEKSVLGVFQANTPIGIFGEMRVDMASGNELIPVALAEEVTPGKARMLTVIDDERVESFEVTVVRVAKQLAVGSKGMVIKVTDPELLAKTGGIVQGMSGSPIIQNGRLIGAVTHVFVNKPDSGYGVFAEWMVQESGLAAKREAIIPAFFYRNYRNRAGPGPAFLGNYSEKREEGPS